MNSKQNQIGERCLLVRELTILNEITPQHYFNREMQTMKDKQKQNKQIQEQLNKSQDNLSDIDIEHINSNPYLHTGESNTGPTNTQSAQRLSKEIS